MHIKNIKNYFPCFYGSSSIENASLKLNPYIYNFDISFGKGLNKTALQKLTNYCLKISDDFLIM